MPLNELLYALDRITSADMWLVVHETYARKIYPDGRPLARADFKPKPERHTGDALNMTQAYASYLAANVIDLTSLLTTSSPAWVNDFLATITYDGSHQWINTHFADT